MRIVLGIRLALLAAGVGSFGGCCTVLLTGKLPHEEPETIVAASVLPDDHLLLDCELTTGRRQRYDADLRHAMQDYAHPVPASAAPLPPSARALRFGATDVARAAELVAGAPPFGEPEARLRALEGIRGVFASDAKLVITIDPAGNFVVTPEGGAAEEGRRYFSGTGSPVNWRHPGSYALCLLYPVTVAIDLVTFPIQAVVLIWNWPHC